MAKNLNLQEQLNNAFVDLVSKEQNEQYAKYLRSITRELIDNIDNLTNDKIKSIVSKQQVNIKDTVLLFAILSAVTSILNNTLTKKEKVAYTPIIALMGLYSVKRPKVFAERVSEIVKTPSTQFKQGSNLVNSKKLVNEFFVRNEASISNSIRKTTNNIIRANRRRANTLTRSIRKDIKDLVSQKKSPKRITKLLKDKYRVDKNVIERNLKTELHAQAEAVKLEVSKGQGATHKTWKSQGDGRVRNTPFHNHVIGKRVPIDSEFRGKGMKADVPGDNSLPPEERIQCRCYLIYD